MNKESVYAGQGVDDTQYHGPAFSEPTGPLFNSCSGPTLRVCRVG